MDVGLFSRYAGFVYLVSVPSLRFLRAIKIKSASPVSRWIYKSIFIIEPVSIASQFVAQMLLETI